MTTTAPAADRVPVTCAAGCRYCRRYGRACGRHDTATDAAALAALAPILARRHLATPDGTACGTGDAFAAVEFTADRVTCPACLEA